MVEIRVRTVDQSDRMTEELNQIGYAYLQKVRITCDRFVWRIILVITAQLQRGIRLHSVASCLPLLDNSFCIQVQLESPSFPLTKFT